VLKRIVPSQTERKRVYTLSEAIIQKVTSAACKISLKAEVSLQGSVAKDTWLSDEADIDIFFGVDSSLDRKELETTCLEVAKDAIKGNKIIERFAEHPYIETFIENARVNIVPCYNVKKGMWKSATDRTPYHTKYMKEHLDSGLKNEVRLLKKLMKANDTYGAEIRVGGFSGMLCETLILYYGNIEKTLQAAAKWKDRTVIDLEDFFGGDFEEVYDLFDQPLIVIDPVDENRNVAAAVRHERLWEFVSVARLFLCRPDLQFFYPQEAKGIKSREFSRVLSQRGTSLIGLHFGKIEAPVDVLWSQIFKTERSITNLLRDKGFSIIRSSSFSDENDFNIIMVELESRFLPKTIKHSGPPVERMMESDRFVSAYLRSRDTLSGPWIEKDRWVTAKTRKYTDAIQLLKESLADGGRSIGVSGLIADRIKEEKCELLVDRQLKKFLDIRGFSQFIRSYIKGRNHWLR
jgi:tRNA nucleotidyltransferase (CCA-adding enzyme)